jgi:transcriptional regulator with XRE-family HTH domain
MDENQAKALGKVLTDRREALKWSRKKLAKLIGLPDVTILRIERGEIAAPRAAHLSAIAEGLGLKAADLFAMADYTTPTDLPSIKPYLRTKYRNLPAEDIEAIEKYAARLARKHGIALDGPAPGEDES